MLKIVLLNMLSFVQRQHNRDYCLSVTQDSQFEPLWVNLIEIFPSRVSHIETRLKAVSGDEVLIPSSTSTNSVSNSSSTEVKNNTSSSNATLSVSGDKNSGDKIELVDDHPLGRLIYKFFQFSRIFFLQKHNANKIWGNS